MDTSKILQKLISIPSWVDNKTNEREIGTWIYRFLNKNTCLEISKQPIGQDRFNVIAQKGCRADILVTGHIDTIQPNSGWETNPVKPGVVGDRVYGRGSSDMKCGIAVMLSLATLPNLKDNISFLFYCDEEYDFRGMKKFILEYKNKIKPKLIISLDGGDLQIGNSCRGLIEMKVTVEGNAGHSANPSSGINAISESIKVINRLKTWLGNYSSKELGSSTTNIAYIYGGGGEGNIIAENCEYIIEIRVASERLNASLVKKFISENSEILGLKIKEINIRHDLGSWITAKEKLKDIILTAPKKRLKSAKKSGYIDIQMLWQAFDKVPTFSLGVGESKQAHSANEYVKISNIMKGQRFYEKLLNQ